MKNEEKKKSRGFTIVELLTVMGVIAILIGLLVPALNLVRDFADEIQQKAQFHALEVAIEMFSTEYGFYPPSTDNAISGEETSVAGVSSTVNYGGAQKLAEALVGYDLLGFHPMSEFRSDGLFKHMNAAATPVVVLGDAYHPGTDYNGNGGTGAAVVGSNLSFVETGPQNIQARTPYMELEKANAYKLEDVYGTTLPITFNTYNLVICDEYAAKRATGKKAGMPVMYWRANSGRFDQNNTEATFSYTDDIYEYADNEDLLQLAAVGQNVADQAMKFPIDFDDAVLNPEVSVARPYRANSYILISAGKDGYYGTADDITNYDKTE